MKQCIKCNELKPLSDFYKAKSNIDGLMHFCKKCHLQYSKNYRIENRETKKDAQLKNKYGITLQYYERILESQNEVCAICGKKETTYDKRSGKLKDLAVDHNNKLEKGNLKFVRGLLCQACNVALGQVKDNIDILKNMIEYLEMS